MIDKAKTKYRKKTFLKKVVSLNTPSVGNHVPKFKGGQSSKILVK